MKISTKTRYGIRMLVEICMAQEDEKTPVPLSVISEKMEVSLGYLRQIALELEKSGIIRGERGLNGGFIFLRPPGKISLKDVFIALEGEEFIPCITSEYFCDKTNDCAMNDVWRDIYKCFIDKLEKYTIKKIVDMQNRKGDDNASH